MRGLAVVGKSFRDWIAGGGVVYIPVVSEMYKLATGGKLQLGKAIFFMCSIHLTYLCKGVYGKWPSEASCGFACRQSLCQSAGADKPRISRPPLLPTFRRHMPVNCRPGDA